MISGSNRHSFKAGIASLAFLPNPSSDSIARTLNVEELSGVRRQEINAGTASGNPERPSTAAFETEKFLSFNAMTNRSTTFLPPWPSFPSKRAAAARRYASRELPKMSASWEASAEVNLSSAKKSLLGIFFMFAKVSRRQKEPYRRAFLGAWMLPARPNRRNPRELAPRIGRPTPLFWPSISANASEFLTTAAPFAEREPAMPTLPPLHERRSLEAEGIDKNTALRR